MNSNIEHNNQLDRIYSSDGNKIGVVKFSMLPLNRKVIENELVSKTEIPTAADRSEKGLVRDNGTV